MRKKLSFIYIPVILIIIISALAYVFIFSPQFLREEFIGGKYDCRIGITGEDSRGFEIGQVFYVKDGVEQAGYYNGYLKDVLEWIKINILDDSVFLNWWDYGHMIVGYAEKDTVVKYPSEEVLISVADPTGFKELESHEKIVDVAKALTTTNETETILVMKKYDATYFLVTVEDGKDKPYWIFHFAGLNFTNFENTNWNGSDLPFDSNQYNEKGKETVIHRILVNNEVKGLIQVYRDENVVIYKRLS